jgi:hypothetical protein
MDEVMGEDGIFANVSLLHPGPHRPPQRRTGVDSAHAAITPMHPSRRLGHSYRSTIDLAPPMVTTKTNMLAAGWLQRCGQAAPLSDPQPCSPALTGCE